ncbi:MAG: 30S ribosomal protein S8 [Candidatus Omnitrophica bacterium]|nr:30S ribosomal protein S8 [Candidatus Omnitrophota bacterium]
MSASDPMADLLTKIRNASRARHPAVDVRSSKFGEQLLVVLKREGFIRNYKPVGQPPKQGFRIYLKYEGRTPVITQLIRISKPGQRQYRRLQELPRVLGGLGRAILTTPKGLLTDHEARRQGLGGEVVCYVW